MCRFIFFISLFCISNPKVFSQNVEQKMLWCLFSDIKKQNEYSLIKDKMKGASLVVNPINAKYEIKYSNRIDDNVMADFSKFSKEEQLKILSCKPYPISLKDTLVLVDSINFFSEGNISSEQGVIVVIRKQHQKACTKCMSLYAVGIRENYLIVTLYNKKQSKQLYSYHFDISNSNVKLQKTSIVDKKVTLE